MAEAVVGPQTRLVAVGVEADAVELVAGQPRILGQLWSEARRAFARHRFAQHGVVGPEIARLERRRLVVDAMGFEGRQLVHGPILAPGRRSRRRESAARPP